MNRGSAMRWVREMLFSNYSYSCAQLREDEVTFDPYGVLCNFIDKDGWKEEGPNLWSFRGEVFYPPPDVVKKCKMKSKDSLDEVIHSSYSFGEVCSFILKNYEDL